MFALFLGLFVGFIIGISVVLSLVYGILASTHLITDNNGKTVATFKGGNRVLFAIKIRG